MFKTTSRTHKISDQIIEQIRNAILTGLHSLLVNRLTKFFYRKIYTNVAPKA